MHIEIRLLNICDQRMIDVVMCSYDESKSDHICALHVLVCYCPYSIVPVKRGLSTS